MTSPNTVADLVGRTLAELGVGYAFGVVGSGNFTVTNALRRHGVPFVAARHEAALPPWPMPTHACRERSLWSPPIRDVV